MVPAAVDLWPIFHLSSRPRRKFANEYDYISAVEWAELSLGDWRVCWVRWLLVRSTAGYSGGAVLRWLRLGDDEAGTERRVHCRSRRQQRQKRRRRSFCSNSSRSATVDDITRRCRLVTSDEVMFSSALVSLFISRKLLIIIAPCGLRGCKNGPAPFPGRMSYKATKPGSVCHVS